MQTPLSDTDKETLLRLAREAVEATANQSDPQPIDLQSFSPALRQPGLSFITLYRGDQLRGCIGGLTPDHPLVEDVRLHAIAAATKDHRFSPLQADEIPEVTIEISVLSIPQPLEYQSAEDLVNKLHPGEDGVIIEQGLQRATFLPQVWKKIPDPKQFLEMLCEKALLPRDAWRSGDLRVLTYQVISLREASI